jgi:hypothetical protein
MCPVRPLHTSSETWCARLRPRDTNQMCAFARPRVHVSRGASTQTAGLHGRRIGSGGSARRDGHPRPRRGARRGARRPSTLHTSSLQPALCTALFSSFAMVQLACGKGRNLPSVESSPIENGLSDRAQTWCAESSLQGLHAWPSRIALRTF